MIDKESSSSARKLGLVLRSALLAALAPCVGKSGALGRGETSLAPLVATAVVTTESHDYLRAAGTRV